jgi:hypothetical protein
MANAVELADNTGAKISADNPLPVTSAASGAVDDEAYTDVTGADEGTIIALLKGILMILNDIKTNTTPAG